MQFRAGEIKGVMTRELKPFSDNRGWLVEVFRSDEVGPEAMPVMGYVSVTRPGVTRGPHEHSLQTDMFCFVGLGTFEVRLWDSRPGSETYGNSKSMILGEEEPTVLIVPPGVVHAYKNVGKVDAMVINLPNRLYMGDKRGELVDEIRHEENPETPYQLE
ncbi:MAG: dTDP-4-dehydrorhamnose 3,5-epimerase family protein [Anaerolineales bacterium]